MSRDAKSYSYKAVARWTKAIKLKQAGQGQYTSVLQYGRLVVPLNHYNSHWTCAVIDLINQELLHLDSMLVPALPLGPEARNHMMITSADEPECTHAE